LFALTGLCLACVMIVASSMAGAAGNHPRGAVYTQSNDPAGNKVIVFDRFKGGTLVKRDAVSTGGLGSSQSVGCGPGCPILDSQNAVVVSENEKLVFAVNAGSDTVSSFRETNSGLQLVDQESSGGDMPESLALHNDVLYVLNVATENTNGTTGNIYGYRVSSNGQLTPNGSSQTLPDAAPGDHSFDPRAIGFKPNGKVIVVTEIFGGFETGPPGKIVTFVVGSHGQAGPGVSHPSSDIAPFGFAFDNSNHLVVSNIHDPAPHAIGTVSSYEVSNSGDVTPINTVSSGGQLPCWVAISKDGKHAYVVNTGAGDPARTTRFKLGPHGTLTGPQGAPAEHTGDFAQTDIDMSRGSKYVYVLAPQVAPPFGPSHIDIWRRHHDGSLTFIGSTPPDPDMGLGTTGLAAN
jgi:hypothetical protein